MPRFRPFPGLRYDRSVPLDKVIAPPYDVVGPDERAVLAARHRANAIHVELPVQDPRTGLDKYRSAAQIFATWREDGVLAPEAGPAFYAYRMTVPDGRSTTGVIGALACEAPGGDVLPHEQTIPKDKSDRLDLLRACRANLSPIWGLSLSRGLAAAYEPDGPPRAEAVDDDGVTHALWVLDAPAVIEEITRAVEAAPVVIADGHHRYETALAYQAERRVELGGAPGDHDLVMALVVELSEGQLSVGPIHRTIAGVPPEVDLAELFGRWFDIVHAGPGDHHLVESVAGSGALALVTGRGVWLLTPREQTYAEAGSDLDSSLVALVTDAMPDATVTYVHDWHAALGAVTDGSADAALLLRPVTVEQISEWAHARKRMPPKSTYFYPKPRTGMVFRTVED
ncbi:MAG TPA: DUF1015 domain-containing protein [Acidimicrobiales bacterium]|nr:DUF1015 domain-containing protein [Acidimicrobiales bacterium]